MADQPLGRTLLSYARAPSDAGSVVSTSNGDRLEAAINSLTGAKSAGGNQHGAASSKLGGPGLPAPLSPRLKNAQGRMSPEGHRSNTPSQMPVRGPGLLGRQPLGNVQGNRDLGYGNSQPTTPRIDRAGSPRSVRSVDVRPSQIWSPSVLSESDFNPPSTVAAKVQHVNGNVKKFPLPNPRGDVFEGVGKDTSRQHTRRDSRPPAFNITPDGKLAVTLGAKKRHEPAETSPDRGGRDRSNENRQTYSPSDYSDDESDESEPFPQIGTSRQPIAPFAKPAPPRRHTVLDYADDDLGSLLDEDTNIQGGDDDVDMASDSDEVLQVTPKAARMGPPPLPKGLPMMHNHHQNMQHHNSGHTTVLHQPAPLFMPPSPAKPPFATVIAQMARAAPAENYQKRRQPSYDYDDKALEAMPFSELKNQAFDFDPAVAPALQTTVGHGETLPAQLVHYKTRTEADQRDFFSRMTVTDWERSGDWFLDQFGDMVQRVIQARKERRAMVASFEREIAAREELVRQKSVSVEKKLGKMKQNGLKLVSDEV